MFSASFSRSACIDNLFASMAALTEPNQDLSKQLKDLFKIYFSSVFYDEENLSDDEDQRTVVEQPQFKARIPGEFKVDAISSPEKLLYNSNQKNNQQRDQASSERKHAVSINPNNVRLLGAFFTFVSNAKFSLDPILTILLHKAIYITFDLPFIGFKTPERSRQIFLQNLCSNIDGIFKNQNLDAEVKKVVQVALSTYNSPFQKLLVSSINLKSGSLKLHKLAEIFSVVKLAKYLDKTSNKTLVSNISRKLFQPLKVQDHQQSQSTIVIDSEDPQKVEFVHDLDPAQKKLYLSLLANLINEQTDKILDKKFNSLHIQKLQIVCLQAMKKFIQKQLSWQDFLVPYWPLLLRLAQVKENQQQTLNSHDRTRILNTGAFTSTANEAETLDLPLCDILVIFVKATMDKQVPLLKIEELRHFIAALFETLDHSSNQVFDTQQNLNQRSYVTKNLIELMDTLAIFCNKIQLQHLNASILEVLMGENGGVNDSTSQSSHSARHGISQMTQLYHNLKQCSLFEQAIVALVKIEMSQCKDSIGQTASFKFTQKVVKFFMSQVATDAVVLKQIRFSFQLISTVSEIASNKLLQGRDLLAESSMLLLEKLFSHTKKIQEAQKEEYLQVMEQGLGFLLSQKNDQKIVKPEHTMFAQNNPQSPFQVTKVSQEFEFFLTEFRQTFSKQKNMRLLKHVAKIGFEVCSKKNSVVMFIQAFVEVLQDLCLEQDHGAQVKNLDWNKILTHMNSSLKKLKSQAPKMYSMQMEQGKVTFLQLWCILVVYVQPVANKFPKLGINQQLEELAQVTPSITYDQEFALSVRMGASKIELEKFFSQFFDDPTQNLFTGNEIMIKNTLSRTEEQAQNIQKIDQKKKQRGQNSDDEKETIVTDPLCLSFADKAYLAFFIYLSTKRIKSLSLVNDDELKSSKKQLKCSNLTQNLLEVFADDTLLIANGIANHQVSFDPESAGIIHQANSKQQLEIQDPELAIQLVYMTKKMFKSYLSELKAINNKKHAWSKSLQKILEADFMYLLKSTCHIQKQARKLAMYFMKTIYEIFPQILLSQDVFNTFLDMLSVINWYSNVSYDSLAHEVALPTIQENIYVSADDAVHQEVMNELINMFTQLFTSAVVLTDKTHLQKMFANYCAVFDQVRVNDLKSMKHTFGHELFSQSISQLNLDMAVQTNLNQLRELAVTDCPKFIQAINNFIPVSYKAQSVLDLVKQRTLPLIEKLQQTSPFKIQRSPAPLPMQKCAQIIDQQLKDSKCQKDYTKIFAKLTNQALTEVAKLDLVCQINYLQESRQYFSDELNDSLQQQKYLQKLTTKFIAKLKQDPNPSKYNQKAKVLLADNFSHFLSKRRARLLELLGCMLALYSKIASKEVSTILKAQIIQTALLVPCGIMSSKQATQLFGAVFMELIGGDSFAKHQTMSSLSVCMQTILSKLPLSASAQQAPNQSQILDLQSWLKKSIGAIQIETMQNQIQEALNDSNPFVNLQKCKQSLFDWSSIDLKMDPQVNLNAKNAALAVQKMCTILETNFYMLNQIASQDYEIAQNFTQSVIDLMHAGYKLLKQTRYAKNALKMHLNLLKLGQILLQSKIQRKDTHGQGCAHEDFEQVCSLAEFITMYQMDFFSLDKFDFTRTKINELINDVKIIDEVQFLQQENLKQLSEQLNAFNTQRSNASSQLQIVSPNLITKTSVVSDRFSISTKSRGTPFRFMQFEPHFTVEPNSQKMALSETTLSASSSMDTFHEKTKYEPATKLERIRCLKLMLETATSVGKYCLNWLKQCFYAWNYFSEMDSIVWKMKIPAAAMQKEHIEFLVKKWPQLALKLYMRPQMSGGLNQLIKIEVIKQVKKAPGLFMKDQNALKIYLDEIKSKEIKEQTKWKTSLWKVNSPIHLMSYLNFKNKENEFFQKLSLKQLDYSSPKTIIFLLPQLFQSLRNDKDNNIQSFLVEKSRTKASVAHNLLWYCEVESEPEDPDPKKSGRKVILPPVLVPDKLPEFATNMIGVLKNELQGVKYNFYRTETNFFEDITKISGLLSPSQTKDEKRAKIREELERYRKPFWTEGAKRIPSCAYLPTNSTYQVVGIVTTSGQPMQSAARVPILISFWVADYPGPDNDKVLQQECLIGTLVNQAKDTNVPVQELKANAIDSLKKFKGQNSDDEGLENFSQISLRQKKDSYGSNKATIQNQLQNHFFKTQTNKFQEDFTKSRAMTLKPNVSKSLSPFVRQEDIQQNSILQAQKNVENTRKANLSRIIRIQNQVKNQALNSQKQQDQNQGASLQKNQAISVASQFIKLGQDQNTNSIQRKSSKNVQFNEERDRGQRHSQSNQMQVAANTKMISCIFKVNDDLRQDILALQIIKMFQKIFKARDLDLYVYPYKCISNRTGVDKMLGGIIECIPNSYSRDQLGKAFEINLNQYFLKKYGNENSEKFRTARYNFIRSLAAYSVVSYILQIKDRHNGNIMVDEAGHLIHIDFGFIFDWSPGRDMRFESADFKLTREFIELLGGSPQAEPYKLYTQKVIQGFLAIREHAQEFMTLVELVFYSGYPCFKQDSLTKLLARFELDKTPLEAAAEMRKKINNAHDKWTTKVYDMIQHRQNKIVF